MALKIDATLHRKLTCTFTRTLESQKIGTLMGSFYPKQKIYELKIDRGVFCHGNEK